MEYLQYPIGAETGRKCSLSFKPCYKWNTFNTTNKVEQLMKTVGVSFKPCYKWNTFNTQSILICKFYYLCFKPCYKWNTFNTLAIIGGGIAGAGF